MKTIATLLKKDLLRDSRHPWGLLILLTMPLLTALLISMVFAPQADMRKNVTIRVAVLDRDDDMLSALLRSVAGQGDAAENLQMQFVETVDAGIKLLEKRKVSALIVLPEQLTVDLLEGRSAEIELYKNPAETLLPVIVEEGLQVLCIGTSQALSMLGDELDTIRRMIDGSRMPASLEVSQVASQSVDKLRQVEPYLFPPLIQFRTVSAADYLATVAPAEDPNR